MINNCVPIIRHMYCKDCKSYFTKTIGDAIGPMNLIFRCPYCCSTEIEVVKENALREGVDFLRNKLMKLFK